MAEMSRGVTIGTVSLDESDSGFPRPVKATGVFYRGYSDDDRGSIARAARHVCHQLDGGRET
jgi:hypothetical protein